MKPMLNTAVAAVRSASRTLLHSFDELDKIQVTEKSLNDFVTDVDKLIEQEIIDNILKSYPKHSILGEEQGKIDGDDYCWIIDPIDGTSNFIHGFPQFSISVALTYKGKTEVGVVYDPIRQDLFTAMRGSGARVNDRKMRVSHCKKLENALLGTGFPFKNKHHLKAYLKTFESLLTKASDVRRAGSAALDLAYVAAGKLDGFWEIGLKEWDFAAGVLLIREAGGLVSDFHGEDNFNESGNIVAGTPKVHKALVDDISDALKE